MSWFGWLILGFALLACEVLVSASFFLLFFGIGALCVGGLVTVVGPLAPWLEWVLFSAISVVLLVVFRGKLLGRVGGAGRGSDRDSLIGVRGKSLGALEPGGRGRGEFRGSTWEIRNVGGHRLEEGAECEVKAVDGLTLDVA
jgi:membrane protein implicated in regulation of membrane protease activity